MRHSPSQLILIIVAIISPYVTLQTPKTLAFNAPWHRFMVIISSLYFVTPTCLPKGKSTLKVQWAVP